MLTIDRVCKSFGSLSVLKDVSLTVGDGEIVALIGPSGCGKTTLLDIISGLSQPDSGTVIGGENISYMFQSARLLPWRTVYENIRLVREGVSPEEIHELIKAVGLEGFANYYPDQLSGGMAKRCALARAFHYQGTHLLMDEPFQGLDYGIRMEMIAMLLSVWKKHRQGILFVTHEIDEALTVASKIVLLRARPMTIRDVISLPGKEGRDPSSPELTAIRQEIIHAITEKIPGIYLIPRISFTVAGISSASTTRS